MKLLLNLTNKNFSARKLLSAFSLEVIEITNGDIDNMNFAPNTDNMHDDVSRTTSNMSKDIDSFDSHGKTRTVSKISINNEFLNHLKIIFGKKLL